METAATAPPTHKSPPSAGLESGVEIGDFRIERRLGAGGMGVVYQARQISLNRPVALKVLGQALSRKTDVARFQREAQAAARLKHPAIAQVYFIGQDRHICYMAMELIEGASLRKVLDRLGTTATVDSSLDSFVRDDLVGDGEAAPVRFDQPTEASPPPEPGTNLDQPRPEINPYLSPQARELRTTPTYIRRVVEVIRDAAAALAHAHEQGVIHRDIKPDNLLLDRQGKVHLIDFGVARFFDDQSMTYTGQLVGTPLYMSPEQVTGRGAIDARTDIYSLGLVLYELLSLRPPIEATNRENLLRTIVTKPLPPVSWRNRAIASDLERIVHKATQKDPDQRYQSAAELSADLDRYLAGRAIVAPPYHFRLDEREIMASRPSEVVLAAFVYLMTGFSICIALLSVGMMMGIITLNTAGGFMVAFQSAIGLAALATGATVAWGVLKARGWGRWIGVGISTLMCLALCATIIVMGVSFYAMSGQFMAEMEKSMNSQGPSGGAAAPLPARNFLLGMLAMYAVPLVAGLLLHAAAIWALVTRRTREWFRLAREIRAEHRRVKAELAA
jgi:serine/threonine protein kinase